jgi:hypothetical protein
MRTVAAARLARGNRGNGAGFTQPDSPTLQEWEGEWRGMARSVPMFFISVVPAIAAGTFYAAGINSPAHGDSRGSITRHP